MRTPRSVGVIGCERVTAFRHLPAMSRLDDAGVVTLAETDAARLNQVADRFHITNRYPEVRALLNDAEEVFVNNRSGPWDDETVGCCLL